MQPCNARAQSLPLGHRPIVRRCFARTVRVVAETVGCAVGDAPST